MSTNIMHKPTKLLLKTARKHLQKRK